MIASGHPPAPGAGPVSGSPSPFEAGRAGDGATDLSAEPPSMPAQEIGEALMLAPEQADWPFEDHCIGLGMWLCRPDGPLSDPLIVAQLPGAAALLEVVEAARAYRAYRHDDARDDLWRALDALDPNNRWTYNRGPDTTDGAA